MNYINDIIAHFPKDSIQFQAGCYDVLGKTKHAFDAFQYVSRAFCAETLAAFGKQFAESPANARELATHAWAQTDWKGVTALAVTSLAMLCIFKCVIGIAKARLTTPVVDPTTQLRSDLLLAQSEKSEALRKAAEEKQRADTLQISVSNLTNNLAPGADRARELEDTAGSLAEQLGQTQRLLNEKERECGALINEVKVYKGAAVAHETAIIEMNQLRDQLLEDLKTAQKENETLAKAFEKATKPKDEGGADTSIVNVGEVLESNRAATVKAKNSYEEHLKAREKAEAGEKLLKEKLDKQTKRIARQQEELHQQLLQPIEPLQHTLPQGSVRVEQAQTYPHSTPQRGNVIVVRRNEHSHVGGQSPSRPNNNNTSNNNNVGGASNTGGAGGNSDAV